jgi:hypothetical protein
LKKNVKVGGKHKTKKALDKALLESVDEGLLRLGESVRHAIYWHIEKSYGVKREEVPNKLKDFHEALIRLFGEGSKVIERLIAKSLYEKLNLSFEAHEGLSLMDYVEDVKKKIKGE